MSKDNNEEEKIISPSFEEFERSAAYDNSAQLFFDLIKMMSPEAANDQIDKTKGLLKAADIFNEKMEILTKTPQGREAFLKELRKKIPMDED